MRLAEFVRVHLHVILSVQTAKSLLFRRKAFSFYPPPYLLPKLHNQMPSVTEPCFPGFIALHRLHIILLYFMQESIHPFIHSVTPSNVH